MVLKLYGKPSQGGSTGLPALILHEKKIPFEFVAVDTRSGEQRSAENLARNTFGLVPSIDDDGFILYESRAICRYIATKYAGQGTPLIPSKNDIKASALFEQAASVEAFAFAPLASAIVSEILYKKFQGLPHDQAKVDENIALLSAKLEVYDRILGKQKYLAGDEVTLVDLFHLANGVALTRSGLDIMTRRPNVARWFNDITSRESWRALNDGIKSGMNSMDINKLAVKL